MARLPANGDSEEWAGNSTKNRKEGLCGSWKYQHARSTGPEIPELRE